MTLSQHSNAIACPNPEEMLNAGMTLGEVEDAVRRFCVDWALLRTRGHQGRAATALCVHRNTLIRIMKEANL